MTKRATKTESPVFTLGSLLNLAAIPAITGAIILIGSYYTTNGTLSRYGEDIKTLQTTVNTKVEVDSAARTKIRDDFLASQIKTTEGIAKLDTRLAVAETTQKTQLETLNKIADTLQKITSLPAVGHR